MDCKASVIIVYTNEAQLDTARRYLERQSIAAEPVFLDNREGAFSSAAAALNFGAERAAGAYLIFMHQDVYLWDENAIKTCCDYLAANPNAIVGAAGITARDAVITDLYLDENTPVPGIRAQGKQYSVDALDECILAMTRKTWQALRFDPVCCDNWHGYGMDICYANRLRGGENVLLPLRVCHASKGSPHTKAFRRSMGRLVDKYRRTPIRQLRGCCISIPCRRPDFYWYCIKENVRALLRKAQ